MFCRPNIGEHVCMYGTDSSPMNIISSIEFQKHTNSLQVGSVSGSGLHECYAVKGKNTLKLKFLCQRLERALLPILPLQVLLFGEANMNQLLCQTLPTSNNELPAVAAVAVEGCAHRQ